MKEVDMFLYVLWQSDLKIFLQNAKFCVPQQNTCVGLCLIFWVKQFRFYEKPYKELCQTEKVTSNSCCRELVEKIQVGKHELVA